MVASLELLGSSQISSDVLFNEFENVRLVESLAVEKHEDPYLNKFQVSNNNGSQGVIKVPSTLQKLPNRPINLKFL